MSTAIVRALEDRLTRRIGEEYREHTRREHKKMKERTAENKRKQAAKKAPAVKAAFAKIIREDPDQPSSIEELVAQGRYCQDVWASQGSV